MSEQTAEQRVREKWKSVSYCSREETNSCCPPSVFIGPFSDDGWVASFCYKTSAEVWQAALAYTEEHAEKIRQLEEQIMYEKTARDSYAFSTTNDGYLAHQRTLDLLQSQLTDLRKGWRE